MFTYSAKSALAWALQQTLYTHTPTHPPTHPPTHTHSFNIYGICRFWLGGEFKDKEINVPAPLEKSQCHCSPKTPRAHLLTFSDMVGSSCHSPYILLFSENPSTTLPGRVMGITYSPEVRSGGGSSLLWSSYSTPASSALACRAATFFVCPGITSDDVGSEGRGLVSLERTPLRSKSITDHRAVETDYIRRKWTDCS